MKRVLVTGSAGLVGSATVRAFHDTNIEAVGIDGNQRAEFFGTAGSTTKTKVALHNQFPQYRHYNADIRNISDLDVIFRKWKSDIVCIVHAAAQPSHDWAASDPEKDFSINATGTLNMLEMARKYCPEVPFIFLSTNKVYGDTPNRLDYMEEDTRWRPVAAKWDHGFNESMSIDHSKHSLFGASKLAADVLVQEYGRYFGMRTVSMRCGCLTGPDHAGVEQHGFLNYLMRCIAAGKPYTIYGYKGKQVRDNLHVRDLTDAFIEIFYDPKPGSQVYNMGGSVSSNCSVWEAIVMAKEISGRHSEFMPFDVHPERSGDHQWWISDTRKFELDYPFWRVRYDVPKILEEIYRSLKK